MVKQISAFKYNNCVIRKANLIGLNGLSARKGAIKCLGVHELGTSRETINGEYYNVNVLVFTRWDVHKILNDETH